MTARDTYTSSVATAEKTKVASSLANTVTFQETVNSVGVNIGAPLSWGVTAAHDTTIRAANATLLANRIAETAAKMASIDAAREALRAGSSDLAPY